MSDRYEKNRQSPYPHLRHSTAWLIIGAAIGLILGGAVPRAFERVTVFLERVNPWLSDPIGKYGVWAVFLTAFLICLKQLSYYYRYSYARKTGIFEELACHSQLEYTLDWALGIAGAALLPLSYFYTPLWLLAFSFYCLLGWYRCRVTLLRRFYVEKFIDPPLRSGLFSNYQGRLIADAATQAQIDKHLARVAQSLDNMHEPKSLAVPYKSILAGWTRSFLIHSIIAATGFLFTNLLLSLAKVTLSVVVTLIWVVLILTLFIMLSGYSLRWGSRNADVVTKQFETGKRGVLTSIAFIFFTVAFVQALIGPLYLSYYVSHRISDEERKLGVNVKIGWFAQGITQGTFVSYMSPIWNQKDFSAEGNNYWTMGWRGNTVSSTRFDPESKFYQAWFGVYIARSAQFADLPTDYKQYKIQIVGRLAELDQMAWLKLYRDPTPEAKLTTWQPLGPIKIEPYDGFLYYGEIQSHSDVGEGVTRYIELFPRDFRGPAIDNESLRSLLIPKPEVWKAKVSAHDDVCLRGYFVVIPLYERGSVACIYANGVRAKRLDGREIDTFPELKDDFMKMIKSVQINSP
jgi:hypothetical protein